MLVCGLPGGFDVLDVERYGLWALDRVPPIVTPTVSTRSGGLHFYFATSLPRSTEWKVEGKRAGDVRSKRNLVTVPPSVSIQGPYTWMRGRSPDDVPFAPVPAWLTDYVCSRRHTRRSKERRGGASVRGPSSQLVSPLEARGGSRSEDDQKLAYAMCCAGQPFDEIVDVIYERPAALDRGNFALDYAERTARKAFEYYSRNVAPCRIVEAELRNASVALRFLVEAGPYAACTLFMPLDWPVSDVAKNRWAALVAALDLDGPTPHGLVGRRLAVEVIPNGGPKLRVGRLFPLREDDGEPP